MTDARPRIYWRFYQSLQRGFWRVSLRPRWPTKREVRAWKEAHTMVLQMNTPDFDKEARRDIEGGRQHRRSVARAFR